MYTYKYLLSIVALIVIEKAAVAAEPEAEAAAEQRDEARLRHQIEMRRLERQRDAVTGVEDSLAPPDSGSRAAFLRRRLFLPSIIGGDLQLGERGGVQPVGIVNVTLASGDGLRRSSWSLTPQADVRLGERITVGGRLYIGHTSAATSKNGERESTGFALEPRVGALIPVADSLVLWPKLRVSLAVGRTPTEPERTGYLGADLELGVLVPLSSHAFVELAPRVAYAVEADRVGESHSVRVGAAGSLGLAF
jgi:hypothetical protein